MSNYTIVITTTASRDDAKEITDAILSEQLAACVQLLAIDSLYTWKGEVACEAEVLLLIKTRENLYSQLEKKILSVHKYETPEILQIPVTQGSPGYLGWIDEVTKRS